jgi:hypothetical protein
MPSQDKSAQTSPFEIVTAGKSRKSTKTGIIVGVAIIAFLVLSVVAGVLLVRQQQNVQEKATNSSSLCPAAEACPIANQPSMLSSCHPGESDGTANLSECNRAGRVETCGSSGTYYCCPSVNGTWTTTMTADCLASLPNQSPSPTPTVPPAATDTPTPTATATEIAYATVTPTPTPTGGQNSCNQTCASNSDCQSGLYCYSGYCRNPLCAADSTCGCGTATATPTPTATATSSGVAAAQTTPLPVPVTGTDWPTVAGIGVGIAAIVASIFLAL